MILQKYTNKRRLGKGAYGDVLLAEDSTGKQLAVKMVSKKIIQKDPYLQEYLDGEKDVMMSVKNKFVMELLDFDQDDNYKYFICQYCDGGDLLNYQARQPNKVFNLKTATKILSQVIQGLEILHQKGYLHRDIKPQNILLKKDGENNYIFKLADFGFAKKTENGCNTVLGTENYMSPEIFSTLTYSYEVDMWAFGVLFYFMLNMEFPFRINPHMQIDQKREELIKQATNFNYSKIVAQNSKKKLQENCTEDVNDLFKKMFNPDGNKRITFVEIREHPLFKQYFPVIDKGSIILYQGPNKKKNRYEEFVQNKISGFQDKNKGKTPYTSKMATQIIDDQNVTPEMYISGAKGFGEKTQLDVEFDRYQFLLQTAEDLHNSFSFINDTELIALKYNLLKFYLILMRKFKDSLRPEVLDIKYPKMKWQEYTKKQQFKQFKAKVEAQINEVEISIWQVYDQCLKLIEEIRKINPLLEQNLEYEVKIKDFSGVFKQSYRQSTGRIYELVRNKLSKGNKFPFLTAIIVICHSFNRLIQCNQEDLHYLFADFVTEKNKQGKLIEFSELRSWMSASSIERIKKVIKRVIEAFFAAIQ